MKIVVYVPPFHYNSGGILCLYKMASLLSKKDQECYLYDFTLSCLDNPFYTSYLTKEQINKLDGEDIVCIYPEIVPGNPLQAKYVIRLFMCDLGVHTPQDLYLTWNQSDIVYHWNAYQSFGQTENLNILQCSHVDPIFKNNNLERPNEYAHIIRKGYKFHDPLDFCHPEGSTLLPDSLSQEELAVAFNQYKYLICYDPYSFVAFMAALCGCIPIVVPIKGVSKEQWLSSTSLVQLHGFNSNLYGIAYGFDQSEIDFAASTLHLLKSQLDALVKYGEDTVSCFIEDLDNLINKSDALNPNKNKNKISYLSDFYKFENRYKYTISVIVPWWDHSELLELWETNLKILKGYEIIFIDNGSVEPHKTNIFAFCQSHKIKLIRNEVNKGFAAANNQGLKESSGYFLLHLNNDVLIKEFPESYFLHLVNRGLAGPGWANNELNIPYLEGWGLCLRKSILEELGGWSEDYGPGYWDDVDLCYRAYLAGYEVTPVPHMPQWIHHKTNVTGRDGRINQLELHVRNRGIFIKKFFSIAPKILIDGVFFQLYKTGIARVWRSLLEQWGNTEFAKHIVVLDRGNTAPKVDGIRYRAIPTYDYNNTEQDRQMLQQVCDEEGADLFISSYYTTPIATPSVFMAYDMIPEVLGGDLNEPMWREKHRAIAHASSYIAISENTAKDINRFFPDVPLSNIQVAYCGVDPLFKPATEEEIRAFKYKYGINKPYFMLGSLGGYKNPELFFQAFTQLANRESFDLLTTGSGIYSLNNWRQYTAGCTFHGLQLEDEELRLAYAGAIALVYPSLYEGFGMPVAEAMACGCPVITTPNASLPEVGGDAVIYVDAQDVNAMAEALLEVQKPSVRRSLISKGFGQAQKFSWATMAEIVQTSLLAAIDTDITGEVNYLLCPDWEADEDELLGELSAIAANLIQAYNDQPELFTEPINLIIEVSGIGEEDGNMAMSAIAMNLMMEEELDPELALKFTFIEDYSLAQWERLLPQLTAEISLNHGRNIDTIAETELTVVTVQGDGNNYVIFPDWQAEEDHLLGMIYSAIETLQDQVGLEDLTLLLNITNAANEEEASLTFSSVLVILSMEGIDLPESMEISFVDFTLSQWQSLGNLLKEKISLPGEFLPDSLPIAASP